MAWQEGLCRHDEIEDLGIEGLSRWAQWASLQDCSREAGGRKSFEDAMLLLLKMEEELTKSWKRQQPPEGMQSC